MRSAVAALLLLALALPAGAGPIADSAARAAAGQRGQYPQQQGTTRQWLGMLLVGTGLGMMVAGFTTRGSGARGSSGSPNTSDTGTRNTTLGLVGVGMVGAGLGILFLGRGASSPDVTIGAKGVAVTHTVRF